MSVLALALLALIACTMAGEDCPRPGPVYLTSDNQPYIHRHDISKARIHSFKNSISLRSRQSHPQARIQSAAPNWEAEAVVEGQIKKLSLADYKGLLR